MFSRSYKAAVTVPPLLLVRLMDPIVILTATSRSAGASPRLTWRSELAFG